jgi:hypothetical protein
MHKLVFGLLILTSPLLVAAEKEKKNKKTAPPEVQRVDCFVSGAIARVDFLWWHPSENLNGFAEVVTHENVIGVADNTSGDPKGHRKSLSYDWSPGFRLGLGWDSKYENWDLMVNWTWFYNHTENHISKEAHSATSTNAGLAGSQNGLGIYAEWLGEWLPSGTGNFLDEVPIQLVHPGPFTHARASWELSYNTVDALVGRSFISRSNLLKPFFGLRAGFIEREMLAKYHGYQNLGSLLTFVPLYNGFSSGSTRAKMEFSGFGPCVGIMDQFRFCCGLRLLGELSAALLYGPVSGSDKFTLNNLAGGVSTLFSGSDFHETREWSPVTNLQMRFGFGWATCFNGDKYSFSIDAAWEETRWFFHGFSNNNNKGITNISLSGLTVSTQFGF